MFLLAYLKKNSLNSREKMYLCPDYDKIFQLKREIKKIKFNFNNFKKQ